MLKPEQTIVSDIVFNGMCIIGWLFLAPIILVLAVVMFLPACAIVAAIWALDRIGQSGAGALLD